MNDTKTMQSQPTKEQLEKFELTHRHAGNGQFMVEDIDDNYCRVTPLDQTFLSRAFLAAKTQLSVFKKKNDDTGVEEEVLIPEDMLHRLQIVRNEIKIGHKVVRDTRIVELR